MPDPIRAAPRVNAPAAPTSATPAANAPTQATPPAGTPAPIGAAPTVKAAAHGAPEVASGGQKLLTAGKPGSVVVNKLEPHEAAFAREIVAHRGGQFVGTAKRSGPGIDGSLEGVPASLKETTGRLIAVLKTASRAERLAKNAGFTGVELFIKATHLEWKQVIDFARQGPLTLDFARKGPLLQIPKQGTISTINILTKDGWLIIP
jgi:hypothetical protein